jgi:hypothetical protein
MTTQSHRRSERIEVLYGIDKNSNAIMEFINRSKYRYDVYADSKAPSYVIKIEVLRKYQSNLAIEESKLASILLCSTLKKVVELQQHVFDTLWKTATPAEKWIKEMEIEIGDS